MTISVAGDRIEVRFAYNPGLVSKVRTIPDREWDPQLKAWTIPATPFHARKAIDLLGNDLQVLSDVRFLAQKDRRSWLTSDLDLSVGDAHLFPYQAGCVEFLKSVGGRALVCDEVGIGKTIEAIAFARFMDIRRILVVCPASILYKWRREFWKWYPEVGERVQVLTTGRDVPSGDVLICSYDIMVKLTADIVDFHPQLVILDEFTRIKNYRTQRFKAAEQIVPGTPYILGLSGTPVLNRPKELFNILNLLDPRAWKWYPFFTRYCGWMGRGSSSDGATNLDELNERLKSFMILRFKRDVMTQIPRLRRTIVPIQLEDDQRRHYRQLINGDHVSILREFPSSKGYFANELDALTSLHQYMERVRMGHIIEWAEDFLNSSDTAVKLVIYCGYRQSVRILADQLAPYGVLEITGEVSNVQRQKTIDRWQNQTTERVMLLTSAGGEGIDLFGIGEIDCSTILFAGRDWSPASEMQVEGRLDRTGQQFPVEAVYLVVENTLDEDWNRFIERKREVIEQSVGLKKVDSIESDLRTLLISRGVTYGRR